MIGAQAFVAILINIVLCVGLSTFAVALEANKRAVRPPSIVLGWGFIAAIALSFPVLSTYAFAYFTIPLLFTGLIHSMAEY